MGLTEEHWEPRIMQMQGVFLVAPQQQASFLSFKSETDSAACVRVLHPQLEHIEGY